MLKGRIIPCLDVKDGRVVKGKKFAGIKDVDDPERLADYYSKAGADELVFYDITATKEGRRISLEFISKVAAKTAIPFAVGGGLNTLDDIARALAQGATKISLNSGAVQDPKLIEKAAAKFGSQAVVLSIDAKLKGRDTWNVFTQGGKVDTGMDAITWAQEGVRLGAGELVINSMDQDGMGEGYDLKLLKVITTQVNVPVIASGGAGTMEHFSQAILEAGVDGVLAASVFHYQQVDIAELKNYLRTKGIGVQK